MSKTQKDTQAGSENRRREVKSFVLRQGRLTQAQRHALDHHWSEYGIDANQQALNSTELFPVFQPITVEIGFGNGESLFHQAQRHPEENFIGIEVHAPGVGHLIHLAHKAGLKNLKVIRHDAVEVLRQQIADDSLQRVQLFFPDPWHKKRHHKRRIIKPEFISLVNQKLITGGLFHMATDWQHYAEQMLEQMDASAQFVNTAGPGHYAKSTGDRIETKFERRGLKLGHGVWDLIYRNK